MIGMDANIANYAIVNRARVTVDIDMFATRAEAMRWAGKHSGTFDLVECYEDGEERTLARWVDGTRVILNELYGEIFQCMACKHYRLRVIPVMDGSSDLPGVFDECHYWYDMTEDEAGEQENCHCPYFEPIAEE